MYYTRLCGNESQIMCYVVQRKYLFVNTTTTNEVIIYTNTK